ncbi:peptidase M75 superfamily protein [Tenacibaculum sp. E3R01]|uniref:imelysin family protein n=1 Tax=unclassified Tenacibaculum TaxID=2635139 RepID=UPI0008957EA7|nr:MULTISPECIES: imelysin family protein [unclassified Tenacibaculum]RBW56647.1 peptidase M75 superfamily protein [Tenacibaculum sp. E3R01]SEE54384.1 Predicted lipoprotein [Tenacibaculum sp. MAR_2010_89]
MKKGLFILVLTMLGVACSSSSDNPDNKTDDTFDRSKILTNVADNIIIPSFKEFKNKVVDLKTKSSAFTNSPTQSTLDNLRTSWYNAYKSWQYVAMFNIGKAEELEFVNFINIYPVSKADIESNITNGGYDFTHPNNHDAQGFPALDFLLHGTGVNDTEILEKYTTNSKAANYKKYVTDVVQKINETAVAVVNDWEGTYREKFVTSTGNTATSSLNKFVNDYIFYYEKRLRAVKIGIPAGNFSSTVLPEKVEAFYKKTISKELALESLFAVKALFNGTYFKSSTEGSSFKAYLNALNKNDLATKINAQFDAAKAQINTLNSNFNQQIADDNTKMTKAYDELQKAVVLLKVDMLQAFNVNVDYVDADGD